MVSGVSQNGWSRNSAIARYDVPGSSCNSLWLNKTAAPLLLYVARRFHQEVAGHDASPLQCWGFARSGPIGNSGIYSNHESGTAIDLNATHYPWGADRMSAADEAKCRAIVKACGGLIRWGGDYNRKLDQMHWEINDGVSPSEVRAQIAKMNLNPNGTVKGSTVTPLTMEDDEMWILRTKGGKGAVYIISNGYYTTGAGGTGVTRTGCPTLTIPGDGLALLKRLRIKKG